MYVLQAKKIEITITEPTIGPDQILKISKTSKTNSLHNGPDTSPRNRGFPQTNPLS